MLSGYDDLLRTLTLFAERLESLGLVAEAARLRTAGKFRVGSPTEFIGESLYALDDVVSDAHKLPPDLSADMTRIADELESSLAAARSAPRRRRRS